MAVRVADGPLIDDVVRALVGGRNEVVLGGGIDPLAGADVEGVEVEIGGARSRAALLSRGCYEVISSASRGLLFDIVMMIYTYDTRCT